MKVKLDYGKTGLWITLPDEAHVTVVKPTPVPVLPDAAAALTQGLRHPICSPPLCDLVQPGDRVGIVFSDITRPTPNHLLIPALLDELASISDLTIVLFNATGTHRMNSCDELREMLSAAVVDRYPIIQNEAEDDASHKVVGTTERGDEISIHSGFVDCDVRILTGFIEPHLFAGFSGGGKAAMPGLALLETVMHNHGPHHMDSPKARWGIREGNPLWEEIREATAMIDPTFLLNVTLNRDHRITGVFAGDWEKAHAEGCRFVRESAMVPLKHPYDIVITSNSGYPLDLNLYQAVKGMSAAAEAVTEDGSIILAADCWDGIPEHGDYGQLLLEADSIASLLEMVRAPDLNRQDTWQAHIQALVCQTADVYVYSHNLTDQEIVNALLLPCHTIERTITALLKRYGATASICVLPQGPQTVPYLG
ncbi:MAG: nickel-dependent lactate racemase [Chloroflexota bacterium]